MSLLTKIKTALGLEEDANRRREAGDQTVTFGSAPEDSHSPTGSTTPATESERAVKEATSTMDPEPSTESAETTEEDEPVEPAAEADRPAGSDDPVTDIKGIGPTYADRLAEAGIETVAALAAADAETIERETGISANRAAGWIERAQAR